MVHTSEGSKIIDHAPIELSSFSTGTEKTRNRTCSFGKILSIDEEKCGKYFERRIAKKES